MGITTSNEYKFQNEDIKNKKQRNYTIKLIIYAIRKAEG